MSDNTCKFTAENYIPQGQIIDISLARILYHVAKGRMPLESYYEIKENIQEGYCNGDSILWGLFCELGKKEKFYKMLENIIAHKKKELEHEFFMARKHESFLHQNPADLASTIPLLEVEDKLSEDEQDDYINFKKFISWIRTLFNAPEVGVYGYTQADIMSVFDILFDKEDPDVKKYLENFGKIFNFAGSVSKKGLEFLLRESLQYGGVINIGSFNHAIGIHKDEKGEYLAYLRDSNGKHELKINSIEELAEKILTCFYKQEAVDDASKYFPISIQIHGNKEKKDNYRPMKEILKDMDNQKLLTYDEIDCNDIGYVRVAPPRNKENPLSFASRCQSEVCLDWYNKRISKEQIQNFGFKPLAASLWYGNVDGIELFTPDNIEDLKAELLEELHEKNNYLTYAFSSPFGGGNVESFIYLKNKFLALFYDPDILFAKNLKGLNFLDCAIYYGKEHLVEVILLFIKDNLLIKENEANKENKEAEGYLARLKGVENYQEKLFSRLMLRAISQYGNQETLDTVLRIFRKINNEKPNFIPKFFKSKKKSFSLLKKTSMLNMQHAAKEILKFMIELNLTEDVTIESIKCLQEATRKGYHNFVATYIQELKKHNIKTLPIIEKFIGRAAIHSKPDIMRLLIKEINDPALAIALALKNIVDEGIVVKDSNYDHKPFHIIYNELLEKYHKNDTPGFKGSLIANIIKFGLQDDDEKLLNNLTDLIKEKSIEIADVLAAVKKLSAEELSKFMRTSIIAKPNQISSEIKQAIYNSPSFDYNKTHTRKFDQSQQGDNEHKAKGSGNNLNFDN